MVACSWWPWGGDSDSDMTNKVNVSDFKVKPNNIPMKLWYDEEAPTLKTENNSIGKTDSDFGSTADDSWEEWSLPIGNGYFGANVFGRTETERIKKTKKTISFRITLVRLLRII